MLLLCRKLRAAAHEAGGLLSVEPYTHAEKLPAWGEVQVRGGIHGWGGLVRLIDPALIISTTDRWHVSVLSCVSHALPAPCTLCVVTQELLGCCDVFSPNEIEAISMVGPGTPQELAARCVGGQCGRDACLMSCWGGLS